MKPASRIADNVRFAVRRIDDTGVFNGLVDILICVAAPEYVIPAYLPFNTNSKFGLPERSQVRIDRSIFVWRCTRFVCVDPKVFLTSAACSARNEPRRVADARPSERANNVADIELRSGFAGEKLEIVFEEHIAPEQSARK